MVNASRNFPVGDKSNLKLTCTITKTWKKHCELQTKLEKLRKELEDVLNHEFITPCTSPRGPPYCLFREKDDLLRLDIHNQALKKLTIKWSYPLHRNDDIFGQFAYAKYFLRIYLRNAFHQIWMESESVSLGAFKRNYGHHEFAIRLFRLTTTSITINDLTKQRICRQNR